MGWATISSEPAASRRMASTPCDVQAARAVAVCTMFYASGTTMAFKPTNVYANSSDCGMRAAKHLRRARPISGVVVVGCHSSFELIVYVAR
jgi:hypothetical protein